METWYHETEGPAGQVLLVMLISGQITTSTIKIIIITDGSYKVPSSELNSLRGTKNLIKNTFTYISTKQNLKYSVLP